VTSISETTIGHPATISVSGRPIHVMHVDDENAFLCMAKQCLEIEEDIEIESVQSVNEAIAILRNRKFDVIVSDYQMNEENGLDFLNEIRKLGITTPFILFTGRGREEIAVKALNSGAFRYLDKRGAPETVYAELGSCIHQAAQYTRAQQMINENQKRFRAIFDCLIDAVLVLNDNGEIIYGNKSAKTMLAYAEQEITKVLHKHFKKMFMQTYEQHLDEGFGQMPNGNLSMAGKTVELSLMKNLKEKVSVEISFSAFVENGKWYGVSIVRDVSERKRQEDRLEESRQTLKALFSHNPESIVFMDKDFRVTDINKSFTKLFGFAIEEIKGKRIDAIVPEGFEDEAKRIEKYISKAQISLKSRRKSRDGAIVDVGLFGGPLQINGELAGFFMVFVDISDLVFVQGVLEDALKHSEFINEKITVLGGFTRHDIRNKLALIQGYTYLARNKSKIEPKIEEYLQNIESSVNNICDILDFAKTYEMIGVEELVSVNVGTMVQNALSLVSDLKGINVENRCQGFEVIADSLLTQVMYNLIDDTLKYGEKTTNICISVEESNGQSAKLIYEDNGVGIEEKFKKNLFQKGCGKGTGLGLYLIQSICEVYGWKVEETGNPGKGARFEFIIPKEKIKKLLNNS